MIKVLCTRNVSEALVAQAVKNKIDLVLRDFISIVPVIGQKDRAWVGDLLNRSGAIVLFTSKHAVNILAQYLSDHFPAGQSPSWKIYCISEITLHAVRRHFPHAIIAGKGSYAHELAGSLIRRETAEEVFFICGNKRRDTLPATLGAQGIHVRELVIYETRLTPHREPDDYQGIIFFSPSAVESYCSVNKLAASTRCFAIGNTTAAAVNRHTDHKVIISPRQNAQAMIQTVIQSFT